MDLSFGVSSIVLVIVFPLIGHFIIVVVIKSRNFIIQFEKIKTSKARTNSRAFENDNLYGNPFNNAFILLMVIDYLFIF